MTSLGEPSLEELTKWLGRRGIVPLTWSRLTGDVSSRRYFRLRTSSGENYILAYYPEALRDVCFTYIRTTNLLADAAVRVPKVLEHDCESGLMLLEDVGARTLYAFATHTWEEVVPYFGLALDSLKKIRALSVDAVKTLNPILGDQRLSKEISQTWDLFLGSQQILGDPDLACKLRLGLEQICQELGRGTLVPCHRDFMARASFL
jgi:aminoglycoside/choline kinase family phosphotransferase